MRKGTTRISNLENGVEIKLSGCPVLGQPFEKNVRLCFEGTESP